MITHEAIRGPVTAIDVKASPVTESPEDERVPSRVITQHATDAPCQRLNLPQLYQIPRNSNGGEPEMDLIGVVVEAGRTKALAFVKTAMATHVAASPPRSSIEARRPAHLKKR